MKIEITANVPDGSGGTVMAVCVIDVELKWIPFNMGDHPLQDEVPALVRELTIVDDKTGTWVRQRCSGATTGHVPDYFAWSRKPKAAAA